MYLDKIRTVKEKTYENRCGLAMSSLPVLGFMIFMLIPMVLAVYMGFCEIEGFDITTATWVGFDNFNTVLNDFMFWDSVGNTFIYIVSLPICMVISLCIAYLLTKNVKGKKIFRTIYFIPYVCSIVAVVLMWKWIFDTNYGVFNTIIGQKLDWVGEPDLFRTVVIVMSVWGGCGFQIILYSAALTNISPSLYEAAKMDGANALQCFFNITLPGVSPTTFYLLVTGLIGSLQSFANTQVLAANGGPDNAGVTIGFYLYRDAFEYFKMGEASASAWLLAIMIMIITVINFAVSRKWVNYD